MRVLLRSRTPAWLLLALLLAGGCRPAGCTCPYAENFDPAAELDNGACLLFRDRFVGSFRAEERCGGESWGYLLQVEAAEGRADAVRISNLGAFGVSFLARAAQARLEIPVQVIHIQGIATEVSGEGRWVGGELHLSYHYAAGGSADTCTARAARLLPGK
jgi:hypothetical protein